MNDRQRRRFERLVRSRDTAATRGADFPANSVGGKALAGISNRIAEIENLDAARSTDHRTFQHGTSSKREAREALRRQLAAISETAQTIALDFPELKDKFRRPRSNFNDQNLLTTARSFHAEATPLTARFIEYNMAANFLDTLNDVIEDFEQAINQQNLGRGGRRANIVALETALDAAEQDLERLDTAIHNKFAGDPATLASWESARRLQSAPKKPKTSPPPPPPVK
jgi:chromosome segregation ATPase